MRAVTFNGLDLQTSTYTTIGIVGVDEQTQVKTDAPSSATSNGSYIRDKKFGSKTIVLTVVVTGTSLTDAETKVDELKRDIFLGVKGNLDIAFAGGTRRWVATVEAMTYTRLRGLSREYEIELMTESFGFDPQATTVSYVAETASTFNKTITVTGSYQVRPIITIEVNSATDLTRIAILNQTNNRRIEISTVFNANDILTVDTRIGSERISLDGVGIVPDGVFPFMEVGANTLSFTVTSTSHSLDIDVQYNKLYL